MVIGSHLSRNAFMFVVNSRNPICDVLTDESKDEAVLDSLSSDCSSKGSRVGRNAGRGRRGMPRHDLFAGPQSYAEPELV